MNDACLLALSTKHRKKQEKKRKKDTGFSFCNIFWSLDGAVKRIPAGSRAHLETRGFTSNLIKSSFTIFYTLGL